MRAAAVLALCLLACKPAALAGRVLATAPGDAAQQHTAPTVMSLTALAGTGSLSLPAADSWPAVESAGAPRAAKVPADKRPPVHRTLSTLTPDRLALAFVPDNRPALEEDEEDESGSHDSDAPAPAPALGAVGATAAVAGTGAPGARGQALSATVSAQPGRHVGQGGVQRAASVRQRSGVSREVEEGPALAPSGVDTAAMIGMGSAFGVLGGTVGPSFSFGGVNVAPGERSVPVLSYHGGSILTQPVTIYLVMYGTWDASVPTGLASFVNALSGTPWMQINQAYTDSRGNRGTATMRHGGTCYDTGTRGASLSDQDVLAVILGCLSGGVLPQDPNGLYYLISSPEVAQKGFCVDYCGWHDVGPNNMLYGFVGSTLRCPSTCQVQTVGPNGGSALDGVASILAHEISETISDPYTDAWYDSTGEEGADKCAWRYGAAWQAANGAKANTVLSNGNSYLLQMNWNPGGGGCTQGGPASSRRR